jgi:uncharacterized protein DUF6941
VKVDSALLCDAATVREGLLHILGGGITRAGRSQFPAPIGLTLALRVLIHPTEADRPHTLEAKLQAEDGQFIGGFEVEFSSEIEPSSLEPGELISMPLPLDPPADAELPGPGLYSFEVLIDGIHQVSVPFRAELATNEEPE